MTLLNSLISGGSGGGGSTSSNLSGVLANGNTTSGNNIVITSPDTISGSDGYVRITGTEILSESLELTQVATDVNSVSNTVRLYALQPSADGYQPLRMKFMVADGYAAKTFIYCNRLFDYAKQTTNATPTQAFTLALSDNTYYTVDYVITARQTGGSTNKLIRKGTIDVDRINAGSATVLNAASDSNYFRSLTTWDASPIVSGNNLLWQLTGVAATTINWQIHLEITITPYP